MLKAALNIFHEGADAWACGNAAEFDRLFEDNPSSWLTTRRWFHDDLKYTFCVDSAFEAFKVCKAMTLASGVTQRICMPAFLLLRLRKICSLRNSQCGLRRRLG